MNTEVFNAEATVRATLAYAEYLHRIGLITPEDLSRIERELIITYKPPIYGLKQPFST